MKKIYMMPSIEVNEIQLESMIAASPITENGGPVTPGGDEIDEDDMAGNRGGSIWEDED